MGKIFASLMLAVLTWMTLSSCFAVTAHHKTITTKSHARHTTHQARKPSRKIKNTHLAKAATQHSNHTVKKSVAAKKTTRSIHSRTTIATTAIAARKRTIINSDNLASSILPGYLLTSIEKSLVDFVRKTVSTLHYSAYKMGGTHIDTTRGVYVVDCSTYVDHIIKSVYPRAYTSLTSWSGSEKPTSDDYYHYFTNLSNRSRHWNTIEDVEELRPGDVLVFRYTSRSGYETGGHVMIVMDKPTRQGNTFTVRIADSAATGHSKDTRQPHTSGVGIGNMLLKVDPQTYQPYAYAWKIGSRWDSNVNFAMARPINVS